MQQDGTPVQEVSSERLAEIRARRKPREPKKPAATFLETINNFRLALARWIKAGRPVRDNETIEYLYYEVCVPCQYFSDDSCELCGCRLKPSGKTLNKLAWKSESCPAGRWGEDVTVESSLENSSLPAHRKNRPRRSGCSSCGKKRG